MRPCTYTCWQQLQGDMVMSALALHSAGEVKKQGRVSSVLHLVHAVQVIIRGHGSRGQ